MEAANEAIIDCSYDLGLKEELIQAKSQIIDTCKALNEARHAQVVALAAENEKLKDAPSPVLLTVLGFVVGLIIGIPITL